MKRRNTVCGGKEECGRKMRKIIGEIKYFLGEKRRKNGKIFFVGDKRKGEKK